MILIGVFNFFLSFFQETLIKCCPWLDVGNNKQKKPNILSVLETNICNRTNTATYTRTLSEKIFPKHSAEFKKHNPQKTKQKNNHQPLRKEAVLNSGRPPENAKLSQASQNVHSNDPG